MEHTIEKRVSDMEALINDIPHILNLRLERFDTSFYENAKRFDEVNARLNLIDKQFNMLTSDMRDLRSGVTRQLIAQDKAIAELRTEVQVFKTMTEGQFTQLQDRMARMEMAQDALRAELKSEMATLKAELKSEMAALKTELKREMAALKTELKRDMAAMQIGFKSEMAAMQSAMAGKLDLILAKLSK